MKSTAVTLDYEHGFSEGDGIAIISPDNRLWKRFLNWILFKRPPTVTNTYNITSVEGRTIDILPNLLHPKE